MDVPAFPLTKLTYEDLDVLCRFARSRTDLLNFWKPLGAVCALAIAARLVGSGDEISFTFPSDLTLEDAAILRNEMVVLAFKTERHGSDALQSLIAAIGIVAGRATKARAALN